MPLDFLKFLPKYSENQKWAAPLIRQGYALPPSPQGEGNIKGGYFSFKRPVTVRYETPCGCVMKRAMPAPKGEALK